MRPRPAEARPSAARRASPARSASPARVRATVRKASIGPVARTVSAATPHPATSADSSPAPRATPADMRLRGQIATAATATTAKMILLSIINR